MLDFDCVQQKLDFLEFTYNKQYQLGEFWLEIFVREIKGDLRYSCSIKAIYQEKPSSNRGLYFQDSKNFFVFLERSFYNAIPHNTKYKEFLQECSK